MIPFAMRSSSKSWQSSIRRQGWNLRWAPCPPRVPGNGKRALRGPFFMRGSAPPFRDKGPRRSGGFYCSSHKGGPSGPAFFFIPKLFLVILSHILDSFFSFSNSNYFFSDSFSDSFLQFEIKFLKPTVNKYCGRLSFATPFPDPPSPLIFFILQSHIIRYSHCTG